MKEEVDDRVIRLMALVTKLKLHIHSIDPDSEYRPRDPYICTDCIYTVMLENGCGCKGGVMSDAIAQALRSGTCWAFRKDTGEETY